MTGATGPASQPDHTRFRHIRHMHPAGYRSGEWAVLVTVLQVRDRDCYLVRFDDGASDFWVVDDPDGRYEFAP